jgi:Eukaryotic protein of unknown function (DUF1764)
MASTNSRLEAKKEVNERGGGSTKRGWDEIESIFDEKKKEVKQQADTHRKEASLRKTRRKKEDSNTSELNDRSVMPKKSRTVNHGNSGDWVDDGLGGKYNSEGYTGRIEDGMKIFKAHVLSKPNAGQTPACPFDCDCCYI